MIDHVVVLGAGIAGLVVTAALADQVGRVTVVDRDRFPARPQPRGGAPQSRHVHTLLLRGQAELESLLPGLDGRLRAAGAPHLDWTEQRFRSPHGWSPRFTSGYRGTFCTRDLLELELRRAVLELPGVRLIEATQAIGLVGGPRRVHGVRLRRVGRPLDESDSSDPGGTHDTAGPADRDPVDQLRADLVIDATGRGSLLPGWVGELGIPPPPETVVTSNLGYASRVVQMPDGFVEPWRLLFVRPPRPSTRGGVLYPVEGARWAVTLAGIGADLPPHDEEGFADFGRSLPGGFGDLIDASLPLTHIASYRRTANRWRHWDRVSPWPDGLLVVGDALCCFNPVYGQGMSVAAVQAGLLRRWLAAAPDAPGAVAAAAATARLGAVGPVEPGHRRGLPAPGHGRSALSGDARRALVRRSGPGGRRA